MLQILNRLLISVLEVLHFNRYAVVFYYYLNFISLMTYDVEYVFICSLVELLSFKLYRGKIAFQLELQT